MPARVTLASYHTGRYSRQSLEPGYGRLRRSPTPRRTMLPAALERNGIHPRHSAVSKSPDMPGTKDRSNNNIQVLYIQVCTYSTYNKDHTQDRELLCRHCECLLLTFSKGPSWSCTGQSRGNNETASQKAKNGESMSPFLDGGISQQLSAISYQAAASSQQPAAIKHHPSAMRHKPSNMAFRLP